SGIVVCKQTCQCCQAADKAVEAGLATRVHCQVEASVHGLVKFDVAIGGAGQSRVLLQHDRIVVGLTAGRFNRGACGVEDGALASRSVPVCGGSIVVGEQICQCCQAADQAVEAGLAASVHGQVEASINGFIEFDVAIGGAG